MTKKKGDKSDWAVGGCLIIGTGVGFFFMEKSPMMFIGCTMLGLGLGLVLTAIISRKNDKE